MQDSVEQEEGKRENRPHFILGRFVIVILATVLAIYLAGFLFLHYMGCFELARIPWSPKTDHPLYRLYEPLEEIWPW